MRNRDWLWVAAFCVAAAVLRAAGLGQALYGDEVFTYDIVVGATGPGDVVQQVHDTSITPPLHYLLAWATVQLGDPTVTVRLPSLILGVATVPLIYLLGLRTVGRAAGLAAAFAFAVAPFALFYGNEARAYETLTFLLTLSTLAMLLALDTRRRRWWVVFAFATAAAFLTHYTALFVLLTQATWALWAARERWREIVIANAGAAVLWLPWLPSYVNQRDNPGIEAIGTLYRLTPSEFFEGIATVLAGHPFRPLADLPGAVALLLIGAGVSVGIVILVRRGLTRPARQVILIAALAVATPLGVLVYQALGNDIYAPRNMIASLPFAYLGLGALVTAPRCRWRYAAMGLAVAGLLIGTVLFLGESSRRTPWNEAAEFIDANAAPDDAVVQIDYFGGTDPLGRKPLLRSLAVELEEPHRAVEQLRYDDRAAWLRVARGGDRVYATATSLQGVDELARAPDLGPRLRLVERRDFDGFAPASVLVYEVR